MLLLALKIEHLSWTLVKNTVLTPTHPWALSWPHPAAQKEL